MDRAGVVYYYHADGLGSVVALTDATEAVAESYSYTPFGAVESTGNVDNPYTYTGREWDPEAGLYYYRARYYDPEVGRFIGKDPIGFAGGDVNLYNYVGGNPVNRTDPSGLVMLDEYIFDYTNQDDIWRGGTNFGPENCGYLCPTSNARTICEMSGSCRFMNCSRKCINNRYPSEPESCSDNPPWYDKWFLMDHPTCWYECSYYFWEDLL